MPYRIFIVEDQKIFLDGLTAIFGYIPEVDVCGSASSGGEALQALEQNQPDVLLLDYNLPDMDGLELTQLLMIRYPDIKILVLTGYDDLALVKKMMEAGARGYLLKDRNDKEDLRLAIDLVARGKLYLDPDILTRFIHESPSGDKSVQAEKNGSLHPLTTRELEVARLVASGLRSKEIATALFISLNTVETHRKNIYSKTATENPIQLRSWLDARGG